MKWMRLAGRCARYLLFTALLLVLFRVALKVTVDMLDVFFPHSVEAVAKRRAARVREKRAAAYGLMAAGDYAGLTNLLSPPPRIFNSANPADGSTPLHAACTLRAGPETVRFLLDNGADPGARDAFRRTPLHNAVIFGDDPATILLLTNRGARADAPDMYGKRPFDYRREGGDGT